MNDLFSFPIDFGRTIRLRVVRDGSVRLTREQRGQAKLAIRELYMSVERNERAVLLAVLGLHAELHGAGLALPLDPLDPFVEVRPTLLEMVADLERDFELGRLLVVEGPLAPSEVDDDVQLTERDLPNLPPPPPIARGEPEERLTLFEVRVVDEIGQPIGGLEVEISAGPRVESLTTNPAGVAILEDVATSFASARIVSLEALAEIVEPRWERARSGTAPTGVNTQSFPLTGQAIENVALKAAVPNTLVITPPVGRLFVELWDKAGVVRLADCEYSIEGPQSFSGITDAMGRLLHEDVLGGDYELTLKVDVNQAIGSRATPPTIEPESQEFTTQLVVLAPTASVPEIRMLGTLRTVHLACARGMLFDTNKNFLLPTALDCLKNLRELYEQHEPSELLVVGHTDTTAEPSINDPLSVERAESVIAYLNDDVQAWLDRFANSVPENKRWGSVEDQHMLRALPDFANKAPDEDAVRWFQRTRGLKVDGLAGQQTRSHLIREYMALDGATLAGNAPEIATTAHGCGENFPLGESGQTVDDAPEDEKEDVLDRRVELFFFNREFGIEPPPPGKNSKAGSSEYPEWRKRAQQTLDFVIAREGDSSQVHLQLLSEDGTEVLSGSAFELELPDATHQGNTDSAGLLGPFDAPPGNHTLKVQVAGSSFQVEAPTTTRREGARVLFVGGAVVEPEEDPEQASEDETEPASDFIEVELRGPNGESLAGEPFELILADGSSLSGVLDDAGFVRIDGVAPGEARITFPALRLEKPRAVVATS